MTHVLSTVVGILCFSQKSIPMDAFVIPRNTYSSSHHAIPIHFKISRSTSFLNRLPTWGQSNPFTTPTIPSIPFSSSSHPSEYDNDKNNDKNNAHTPKPLIPEENPYFTNSTMDIQSRLKPYTSLRPVLEALHGLYPPSDLQIRNGISRTDGYWSYINNGKDPPLEYTYGEFDFYFFADLLDRAHAYHDQYINHNHHDNNSPSVKNIEEPSWEGKVFCDIGSGTGRLVLAAAALHPGWKLCKGIEILEGIHNVALQNLELCKHPSPFSSSNPKQEESNDMEQQQQQQMTLTSQYVETDSFRDIATNDDFISDVMATLSSLEDSDFELEEEDDIHLEEEEEYDPQKDSLDRVDPQNPQNNTKGPPTNITLEYALPIPSSPTNNTSPIPLAPIQFIQGSFADPYLHLSDIDIAFVFSSCMSPSILTSLSQALGRQCRPGTIVITTDYPLICKGICEPEPDDPSMPHGSYELEILDQMDGYCWLVGGITTAYIHVVKTSLWKDYGRRERTKPELPLEEMAFRILTAMEEGTLTDTKQFLKGVYNNMMFLGLPSKWTMGLRQKIEELEMNGISED